MNTTASASRESVTVTSTVKEQDGSNHQNPEERDENKMEELQKQLEALQTEKDALVSEKETLVSEKEALEAEKASLVTEKEALQTKLDEATSEVNAEKAKVTEKEQALAEKEAALVAEQEAREQLVDANTALASEVHESKVAHLVDLRVALGKESSKEEATTKFKARSIESINDSILDLAEETFVTQPVTRVVEKVEHPATQVTPVTTQVSESLTSEDVLIKLLLGRK
jgi:chromosome segregation ATPase